MYESMMLRQRTTGRCPCDVDCATANLGPIPPTGTAVANIHARSDMKGIDDGVVDGVVDDDVVRAVEMVFPGDTVMVMLLRRMYRMDWQAWRADMNEEEDMDSSAATEDRRDSMRGAAGPAVVVVDDDGRETHHSFAANAAAAVASTTTGRQTGSRPGTMTSGRPTDSTHPQQRPRATYSPSNRTRAATVWTANRPRTIPPALGISRHCCCCYPTWSSSLFSSAEAAAAAAAATTITIKFMIWAIATIKNSGAVFVCDKERPTNHGPVVKLVASGNDHDQESWIMMVSRTDWKVRVIRWGATAMCRVGRSE
jgi:hypothetical protein